MSTPPEEPWEPDHEALMEMFELRANDPQLATTSRLHRMVAIDEVVRTASRGPSDPASTMRILHDPGLLAVLQEEWAEHPPDPRLTQRFAVDSHAAALLAFTPGPGALDAADVVGFLFRAPHDDGAHVFEGPAGRVRLSTVDAATGDAPALGLELEQAPERADLLVVLADGTRLDATERAGGHHVAATDADPTDVSHVVLMRSGASPVAHLADRRARRQWRLDVPVAESYAASDVDDLPVQARLLAGDADELVVVVRGSATDFALILRHTSAEPTTHFADCSVELADGASQRLLLPLLADGDGSAEAAAWTSRPSRVDVQEPVAWDELDDPLPAVFDSVLAASGSTQDAWAAFAAARPDGDPVRRLVDDGLG